MAKIPPGVGPGYPQVVVLFGARRLPEIGRGLGEGIRSFKSALKGGDEGNRGNEEGRGTSGGGTK